MSNTTAAVKQESAPIEWAKYLAEVVTAPGKLSAAYSAFWEYSIGNQLLAMSQCMARGIELGPLASFNTWKDKSRFVKKGEKAIELCMPVMVKDKTSEDPNDKRRFFVFKKNWFVLAQTQGEDYTAPQPSKAWDKQKALKELDIQEAAFSMMTGNCQGFAENRRIAISPLAVLPHKTTFHELAHIVLGHTAESQTMTDNERTPRDIREVEAESTAYILCNVLELPGLVESRGYVQSWLQDGEISNKSAQRIMTAADKILRAGLPANPKHEQYQERTH